MYHLVLKKSETSISDWGHPRKLRPLLFEYRGECRHHLYHQHYHDHDRKDHYEGRVYHGAAHFALKLHLLCVVLAH